MVLDPSIPDEDPYFAWARAQQLAVAAPEYPPELATIGLQPPPPPPPPPPPARDGVGRKGGSPSGPDRIGPSLVQGGNETPLQVAPLPDPAAAQPPVQTPAADAVSGAAPAADVSSMVDMSTEAPQDPNAAPDPTQIGYSEWARQQAAGEPLPSLQQKSVDNADAQERQAIANMSDEDYAHWKADRNAELSKRQIDAQAGIDRENEQRQAADLQLRQYAVAKAQQDTQQVLARAKELADTKVVRPKASIANAIGIVLGGMFSQNGQNLALQQFNRKVDQDIALQHENIQNGWRGLDMQKTAIGDEYARSGDLYHAQETYRLAAYQSALNDMQTTLQQYDPAGTKAAQIRDTMQQFHNAQAQSAMALDKYNVDRAYKQAQTAQALAGAFKTSAETDTIKAKQAAMGAAPPPANVLPPEYYKGLGLAVPPAPMSIAAYKDWLSLGKSSAETAKAQQDAASNANATTIAIPHGDFAPLVDKNGNPIRVAADVAKELNEQNASAQNVVSDLNDVKRMLEEDPSTVDRTKWAEIQARIGQSLPAIAGYYKSKFSSKEEVAIKDVTNLDFDSYVRRVKDKGTAIASIGAIVDTVKRSVDTTNSTTLHAPVKDVLRDTATAARPQPTEIDRILAKLSTSAHEDPNDASKPPPRDPVFADKLAQQRKLNRPEQGGPTTTEQASLLDRAEMFAHATVAQQKGRWYLVDADGHEITGVPPADTAAGGEALLGKYRDTARAGLGKLSADAESEYVRERAGQITQALAAHDMTEAP